MEKKVIIALVGGLIIGFLAGYFASQLQDQESAPTQPAAAASQSGAGMGAASPESDAQAAQLKQIQKLEDALRQNPGNLEAIIQLGNIYYDSKQFDKAVGYYEQAAKLDPKNLSVRVDMATARWYLGQTDPAIAGLQAVLKEDPNHPQALYNMGIIMLHGTNDLKGAREYWSRLVATQTTTMDLEMVKQRLAVIDKMISQEQSGQAPWTPPAK
jgi:cytochrome c-type biogenesis protein CcmH/NrfG